MPRRGNQVQKSAEQPGTTEPVTSAETVVVTLPGVSPDDTTPRVLIEGSCDVIGGATATTVVVRVRRGTTAAGTLVSKPLTSALASGVSIGLGITALDTIEAEVASQPYVLTIEQPGATTNPKVTGAVLTATL